MVALFNKPLRLQLVGVTEARNDARSLFTQHYEDMIAGSFDFDPSALAIKFFHYSFATSNNNNGMLLPSPH